MSGSQEGIEPHINGRPAAVADIGSNTVHLLVARTDGHRLEALADESVELSLGRDVDLKGEISPGKLEELLATVQHFLAIAEKYGLSRFPLLATEAMRAAKNRRAIIERITQDTGLQVTTLSTEEEARLGFIGAQAACPSEATIVVVDIGGGSVQITLGKSSTIAASTSLPLGALALVDRFLPNDPPSTTEEAALHRYLASALASVLPRSAEAVAEAVGIGGTLRRLPAVLGLQDCQTFPADGLERILSIVRGRSAEELGAEYGVNPERAKLVLPAVLLLQDVLKSYGLPALSTAPYGVREGAILWMARSGNHDFNS